MENQNRKRDIQIVFRVTAEERAFIQEKMRSIGITNFREYARQMATMAENWDMVRELFREALVLGSK